MAMSGRSEVGAVLPIFLGVALLSCGAVCALRGHLANHIARPGLADADHTVFDVTEYGAKSDGKTDNVQAFMKAWNAACKSGGAARLLIPTGTYMAGQVEFQGPCQGPMTVEVQGTIKAQTDISQYPSAEWFTFESVNNLEVTGGGTFDGQGSAAWKYNNCGSNAYCKLLPTSLKFTKTTNAVVRGITSLNSKSFHFMVHNCQNFRAEDIHITAPGDSPNTDGIHVSRSNLVNITNSIIATGDDCVSIGQGSIDISITGVTCGPGHGISIGSLGKYKDEEDVKGITVKNCTLTKTTNGARIKTWPGSSPSTASSISFEDIVMDSVKNPIIIDQKYWSSSKNSKPSQVKLSDVKFSNIRGTSVSEVAVSLVCSEAVPCEGVQLQDIDLSYGGDSAKTSSCENVKPTVVGTLNPPACQQ
ncbi:exopolygalacturonase-like [Malania oleifera]|uniref:exopolygalacturonase-like n=1 Tax=Malania oleifera TaxID=397392 RepID=UPI0025AE257C|nr:exopolygalacturonase-like [Malania oleifera]